MISTEEKYNRLTKDFLYWANISVSHLLLRHFRPWCHFQGSFEMCNNLRSGAFHISNNRTSQSSGALVDWLSHMGRVQPLRRTKPKSSNLDSQDWTWCGNITKKSGKPIIKLKVVSVQGKRTRLCTTTKRRTTAPVLRKAAWFSSELTACSQN